MSDEKACARNLKNYYIAIKKWHLDDIPEFQENRREYMKTSFCSGFYAGRDYMKQHVDELEIKVNMAQEIINGLKYGDEDLSGAEK